MILAQHVQCTVRPCSLQGGTLDLSAFDVSKGGSPKPLPVVKLVDNFDAQWEVVANEGHVFTLMTNHSAPRYKCALLTTQFTGSMDAACPQWQAALCV